jgi:hypothetical protein
LLRKPGAVTSQPLPLGIVIWQVGLQPIVSPPQVTVASAFFGRNGELGHD